jgi:hypothetical protein
METIIKAGELESLKEGLKNTIEEHKKQLEVYEKIFHDAYEKKDTKEQMNLEE